MGKLFSFLALLSLIPSQSVMAASEFLIKFHSTAQVVQDQFVQQNGGSLEQVSREGKLFKWTTERSDVGQEILATNSIAFFEKNIEVGLIENPSLTTQREALLQALGRNDFILPPWSGNRDNPDISPLTKQGPGPDTLLGKAWGILRVNAHYIWENTPAGEGVIVAVTDTGVDYNHEDLIHNMWRNTKEIPGDGIDNDGNGYVDDIVGWDFYADDNKPFDATVGLFRLLFTGGNPGHGTHCAGVVAARRRNNAGVAGVAPNAKLMALRMIGASGRGDLAYAVKAIDYAVANGAKVISASWGTMGEGKGSEALKEALMRAEDSGVIFVAAAGNGRQGKGYDNDSDAKAVYPASYDLDNIISVAAMDSNDNLAKFSNWGKESVDIGAPGVKIVSTIPGNKYQDTIISVPLLGMKVTWNGTSMATPFVSGAVAALWSNERTRKWFEIKEEVLGRADFAKAVEGKVATDGRLNLAYSLP